MKHFKQFLLAMLVALTSSVLSNAQSETRATQINDFVDLDDVALLGEWTVIDHTNSDNQFAKVIFTSSGAFSNWNNESAVIICNNGNEYRFYEYWLSGSMMGRFTLHMGFNWNNSTKPSSAHFIVKSFQCDEMVLATYDEHEVITLKRNNSQEQNGPQIVDLGLSVNWASYNLGATAPEEAGELYSWDSFLPETMWGEGWRLPTENEARELVNSCRWEEVILNGEKVMKATGSNGNSVLFPNTNCISAGSPLAVTENGYYWTSTLDFDVYVYFLVTGNGSRESTGVFRGTKGNLNYSPKLAIRPVTNAPASSGIQSTSTRKRTNTNVYDLNGRVIKTNAESDESLNDLPKGIYIVDGKKIGK